jgi:DNA replication and repair protein RecF
VRIQKLNIQNFRNLASVELSGLAEFNFFHGLNGSGKTSVLEAIHTLALTRSFRSRKMKTVIAFGENSLIVRGEFCPQQLLNHTSTIGIKRSLQDAVLVKLNGETLSSVGELAGVLPVQVINPASFELLEGGPGVRRQFLDWGVFHVKHSGFHEHWPRYRKALQQRNSLLRRGNIDALSLQAWDVELAASAEVITAARVRHFSVLAKAFDDVYRELLDHPALTKEPGAPADALSFSFDVGWKSGDNNKGFAEVLKTEAQQDLRSGYTRYGPHRADININCGKFPAGDVLSRGQIKTVVCALKLAQSRVLAEQSIETVFLIDDLAAELDPARCESVFAALVALNAQVFATSVQRGDLDLAWCMGRDLKRFHVEHGCIAEL